MSDLRLLWDPAAGGADLALVAGGAALDTSGGLETLVTVSLFTDRVADPSDVLPPGETDRRGWWADMFLGRDHPGDRIGSRLWLLERAKSDASLPLRARGYVIEALQWLIDDGYVAAIDCQCAFLDAAQQQLGAVVTLYRHGQPPTVLRYDSIWNALGAAPAALVPRPARLVAWSLGNDRALYVLDLLSGTAAKIGATGLGAALGLASGAGGALCTASGTTLYRLDPGSGAAAAIGAGGPAGGYAALGDSAGVLYALGSGASQLYAIDPATGNASLIGATGLPASGLTGLALSTGGAALYALVAAAGLPETLYVLDIATGAANTIGATGAPGATALTDIGGRLYAAEGAAIWTIDPGTGTALGAPIELSGAIPLGLAIGAASPILP